ncbi:MAG: hypothetical protein ABIP78_04450 [Pyrinomonadaceae bacterium]
MNRRDAETLRKWKMENGKWRMPLPRFLIFHYAFSIIHFLTLCLCVSAVNFSCSSKPTDLRTLVPAETLIYLETNDLAAALQPIVDSKPFMEVAKSKPDFSALKGVQLAVAVTGFQTSEEKLTDEHSVGRIQPHFVAIADTHAWQFQTVTFAEQKLGAFVAQIYDSEPTLEKAEKSDGRFFTWTAKDGRKAYALVKGGLIYFGNDESAIDKCLAVRSGEADSIAKTGKVRSSPTETLATGYVSSDGIAQIANIVALKFAAEAGDNSDIQSAIAGFLPQLLRNLVTEISWTATKTEQGIEDKYIVSMPPEIANIFSETLGALKESEGVALQNHTMLAQLPEAVQIATRYNLKDPQIAWRSILLVGQKSMGNLDGRILSEFANLLFDPYSIRDPELFLGSIGNKPNISRNIITAKLDVQSDDSFVIAGRGDDDATRKSLFPGFKPPAQIIEGGLNIWTDEDTQVAFDQDMIKIGPKDDLQRFNGMRLGELKDVRGEGLRRLGTSKAPVATFGRDTTTPLSLVEMLAHEGNRDTKAVSTYYTETRFTKSGMERQTTSDFGLIGSIIAQLGSD